MKTVFIILVVLVLLAVGAMGFMGYKSQSGAPLGLVGTTLAACPDSPNCVCSETGTAEDKSVQPLPTSAWPKLAAAVAAMGGEVTRESAGYIAAEFTSSTFKFVDDVEFRLADDAVHVRSASRVGHSDAGVNAKRVAALRTQLGL